MAQPDASPVPKQKATIGRYHVIRKLGAGSQGVVYLAENSDIGRQVAIKTLSRHGVDKAVLLGEARNVGRLKHPNIAAVFDIGSFGDTPYVVYELIAGESLCSLLRKGPAEAADIFK